MTSTMKHYKHRAMILWIHCVSCLESDLLQPPPFTFAQHTKTRDLHLIFFAINLRKSDIIVHLWYNSFIVIRARHHKTRPYQRHLKYGKRLHVAWGEGDER